MGSGPSGFEAVDDAIRAGADGAFSFLERLIGAPSTVGEEAPAQRIVADELARLGFDVAAVPIPPRDGGAARRGRGAGPLPGPRQRLGPPGPGRFAVAAAERPRRRGAGRARGSGGPTRSAAVTSGGWMTGRGAGDMKGGFAMGLLAVAALRRAMPGALAGELAFLSVIEEECTGNGTLAACHAGVLGDAAVAARADRSRPAARRRGRAVGRDRDRGGPRARRVGRPRRQPGAQHLPAILQALAGLEEELNAGAGDPAFRGIARPYNVNAGTVTAGRLGVERARPGPPAAYASASRAAGRADEAFGRVEAAVLRAAAGDPGWPSTRRCSRQTGFRAEGYLLASDHPLANAMADAHARRRRRPARAGGDRRHHRRQVLPQPVRRARPGLRPGGAQHPRRRRGGRAGQHRARRPDPGQVHRRFFAAGGLPGEPLGQEARR